MTEAQRAHLNMIAFYRRVHEGAPGARVEVSDEELLFAPANPFPFFSQAVRWHERDDGTSLLARCEEFFGERGHMLVVRPGADDALEQSALAAGFNLGLDRYPEMVCTEPAPEGALADGYELRAVADEDTARAYWRMSSRAYVSLGCPPGLFDEFPVDLLLADDVDACVAERDGEVVAGALAAELGDGGYVGWVGTVEEARRRGLASACTAWATNRMLERGVPFVSLEASSMGDPVYPRLGYRELYSYRLYLSPSLG
jgi:ribosomal protein S18 acetylase RimI-like enzyme